MTWGSGHRLFERPLREDLHERTAIVWRGERIVGRRGVLVGPGSRRCEILAGRERLLHGEASERRQAHVGERDADAAIGTHRRYANQRPVLRPTIELEEATPADRLLAADLGQQ